MAWPILTEGLLPRQSLLLSGREAQATLASPKRSIFWAGWVEVLREEWGGGAGEARLLHSLGIEGQSPAPTGLSRLIQV